MQQSKKSFLSIDSMQKNVSEKPTTAFNVDMVEGASAVSLLLGGDLCTYIPQPLKELLIERGRKIL